MGGWIREGQRRNIRVGSGKRKDLGGEKGEGKWDAEKGMGMGGERGIWM